MSQGSTQSGFEKMFNSHPDSEKELSLLKREQKKMGYGKIRELLLFQQQNLQNNYFIYCLNKNTSKQSFEVFLYSFDVSRLRIHFFS